jgi:hypothetical protein
MLLEFLKLPTRESGKVVIPRTGRFYTPSPKEKVAIEKKKRRRRRRKRVIF